MKFLSVNTAGPVVETALNSGKYFHDENSRNASAVLMPAVDNLLCAENLSLSDLDYIACVVGPGSFTGIRIGVSSVRAMCYATGKKAVAVNYLQMLAYNTRADGFDKILCISDGSNGTAYIAEFDSARREISPVKCVSIEEAVEFAHGYTGAVCCDERTASVLPSAIPPSTDCSALIRASADLSKNATDYVKLLPLYIRESQAEKDYNERNRNA